MAIAVYEGQEQKEKSDNGRYLSIDPGVNNNFTCYDSIGESFIINGFMDATHYYDKKIAYYQSISDAQQAAQGIKYPKKSNRVLNSYRKKKHCVNNFLHKATREITEYCYKNNINRVIVGDIKGIREDKNIGRNNQQLHSFPYEKAYQLLEYKLKRMGIVLIKQKEYYSNQCSPDTPKVSKKYAKKNNRKHRGLYITDKAVYNADCVGAYNILRLYLEKNKKEVPMYGNLSSPIKVTV
jgi:putative transposase